MIGCVEHQEDVTSHIIKFFIIFRLNIICKDCKTAVKNCEKVRELRKIGKLY